MRPLFLLFSGAALGGAAALFFVTGPTPLAAQASHRAYWAGAKPIGPYSPAVGAGDLVFLSGQIGLDPATGNLVEGGIKAETERALENLRALLKDAGLPPGHVVRATVYLADIGDFQAMNEIYSKFFEGASVRPARSTVGVAALPRGARVEIDFIAAR